MSKGARKIFDRITRGDWLECKKRIFDAMEYEGRLMTWNFEPGAPLNGHMKSPTSRQFRKTIPRMFRKLDFEKPDGRLPRESKKGLNS